MQTVVALERCETLPRELSLEEVANMPKRNDVGRSVVLQTLGAPERRGTDAELTRAIAEALDGYPQTNEAMSEHAKRVRLEGELSLARKRLEHTRARLEASRGITQRTQAKAQRLQKRGDRLAE